MKAKLLFGLCVFTLLPLAYVNGQEFPEITTPRDQIGPSPTAGTLGAYGGVDIRKSSGGIYKSIPLFQLQQGAIKYNPSIEYFSTGVRVNDWGGRLGIGWGDSFDATIQRNVGTIPDEYANRRLTAPVYQYFQEPATQERVKDVVTAERNANQAVQTFDPEYDIFSFNIFGNTGQFVIVNKKAVLLTHSQKMTIEILSTSPTYTFCLKDVNGFKYYFENEIEFTSSGVEGSVRKGIATAWFIDKIVSPLNDELTFDYAAISYGCTTDFYQNFTYKNGREWDDYNFPPGKDDGPYPYPELYYATQNSYGESITYVETKRIRTVTGNNFKLSFGYGISREDLIGAELLKEIVLLDKQNGSISKVTFEYDTYYASSRLANRWLGGDYDLYPWRFGKFEVRYFLTGVEIGNHVFSQKKEYGFSYTTPENLPPRFSFSQDEGGYFNGITNNWFLPKARVEDYIKRNPRMSLFPMPYTGDRRTTEAAKAGILNKITYPTGGVDLIECELNTYTAMVEDEYITTFSEDINNLNHEGPRVHYPDEFDWLPYHKAVVNLDWDIYEPGSSSPPEDESDTHYAWFYVFDNDRGTYTTFYVDGVPRDSLELRIDLNNRHRTVTLESNPKGDITFKFKLYGQYMRVRYEAICTRITNVERDLPFPGLRVKQVTTKSHSSPDMVKKYVYKNFSQQGNKLIFSNVTSSHITESDDVYVKRLATQVQFYLICVDLYYYNVYSGSRSLLNEFGGKPITYSSVTEQQGNAFTASFFDVAIDQPGYAIYGEEFYLPPRENSSWNNGLELKRYYGIKNASDYSVVKEQRWDYEYSPAIAVENCSIYKRYSRQCPDPTFNYEPYTIVSYNLWGTQYNLGALTEIVYAGNGQSQISQKIEYGYNDKGLLTSEERVDSKNDLKVRTVRYPDDIDAEIYRAMSLENLLNYPIEETVRVNGNVVQSKLMTYKEDGGNFVPDKVYVGEISSPLSSFSVFNGTIKDPHYSLAPEVEYVEYNTLGRIVKSRDKNGIYTYYLWAYNKNYPIAKIESSEDISMAVSVDDNSLSKSDALTSVKNDVVYLKGLLSSYINNPSGRSLAPPARYQVNIYTYKPLVGMTSHTDVNGLTTYYEYDDLGRLNVVRNDDGDILKVYTYHYQEED